MHLNFRIIKLKFKLEPGRSGCSGKIPQLRTLLLNTYSKQFAYFLQTWAWADSPSCRTPVGCRWYSGQRPRGGRAGSGTSALCHISPEIDFRNLTLHYCLTFLGFSIFLSILRQTLQAKHVIMRQTS